jgi:hypothetical protein
MTLNLKSILRNEEPEMVKMDYKIHSNILIFLKDNWLFKEQKCTVGV